MNRALAAGLLAAAVGCHTPPTAKTTTATTASTSRSQAADDPADPGAVITAGGKTVVGNVEPITVSGVGLVHGLRGTGSSPPPGELRAALENMILKAKGSPKELLDDPGRSTSLVLVTAVIPPGAHTGDRLDVTVTLPPGSKTSSLKGGVLFPCDLANYESAGAVRQSLGTKPGGRGEGGAALKGDRLAVASGPLVSGRVGASVGVSGNAENNPSLDSTGTDTDTGTLRAGKVWGGARVLLDRPYYLLLTDGSPQPRLAMVIAERLNATFHAPGDRSGKTAEAKVQGKPIVVAHVLPAYRLNHPRFLLVARQVPLAPVDASSPYRQQLEHDLVRPETALTAAVKLEALGPDSRQPLRVGLQSDSPWVRFASAEALAYLGHPDGAKDLAELADKHPALRTHCLTALASMDDGACLDLLAELMRKPDPELRYGAFAALRSADPNHEAVRGKLMNGSFWLHAVAADPDPENPSGTALVHVTGDRRAEIVLFGSVWPVRGPVSLPLGSDFTVTGKGDGAVTVTRVTVKDGEPTAVPVQCRADLPAVLAAIVRLGGTYPEAVELISKLEKADALAAAVGYDSAPRGFALPQLAQMARNDADLAKADADVVKAGRADAAIQAASYNQPLPTDADAVKEKPPEPPAAEPELNREPGRLFGPKRPEAEPGPELNKEPGRLFGAAPVPAKK